MKKHVSKSLSLILCLLMVFSVFLPVSVTAASMDYESHWAKDTIQSAITSGLATGYPDGSFKPDNAITRAEFFALVNNAFKLTAASVDTYTDVAADAWYAPVISRARAAGYVAGYPDGSIGPNYNITRQEAALILSKVKSIPAVTTEPSFTDASGIASWSKPAISSISSAKIMSGYPDGSFKPEAQIKRAEALVAIMNSVLFTGTPPLGVPSANDTVYDSSGTYGISTETTTIDGNLVLKAPGITLQNTTVKGDLTIDAAAGDSDITLKSVIVEGMIHVYGGGEDSVYFVNVTTGEVHVKKDGGPVRIVASGTTAIDKVTVESDVELEESDLSTGTGFDGITVEKTATGIAITLTGVDCDSFVIDGEGVTLTLDEDATIGELTVNGMNAEMNGEGVISNAIINADGADFEKEPTNMEVASGIEEPTITPRSSSGGGGGGGGGGGSSNIALGGIDAITGTAQVGSVLTAGALTPTGATASYQWQISATAEGGYTDIPLATGNTYTPAADNVLKFVKVVATGTGSYTGTVISTPTVAISTAKIGGAAISGITIPATGGTPVSTATETAEYTASVVWDPNNSPFVVNQVYTATITIMPKAGYTLTGVTENFFTVAGATATNAVGSGVVTAIFPATTAGGNVPVSISTIEGVAAPVVGATPVTTITESAQFTGTVIWTPSVSQFGTGSEFAAEITLVPKAGFSLSGVAQDFFTVLGATATNPIDSGVVTAIFPDNREPRVTFGTQVTSTTLKVYFSEPMEETSAEIVGNYTLGDGLSGTPTSAELIAEDEVLLTVPDMQATGAFGSVTVDNVKDLANNMVDISRHYTSFDIDDTAAPTVLSASFTDATTLIIVYSEAVTSAVGDYTNGTITVNGAGGTAVTFAVTDISGSGTDTITLTVAGDVPLVAGDSGTIEIGSTVMDLADPTNPLAPVTQTVGGF